MLLEVKRLRQGKNSTLSEIHIDGQFFCYGLEDSVRSVKVKGSTAIPSGVYPLAVNGYGAMNARYKRKFPKLHQGMIEIKGIPDFSYVYLHIGNNFSDTAGCILVGRSYIYEDNDYVLLKSKSAYQALYSKIMKTVIAGEVNIAIG